MVQESSSLQQKIIFETSFNWTRDRLLQEYLQLVETFLDIASRQSLCTRRCKGDSGASRDIFWGDKPSMEPSPRCRPPKYLELHDHKRPGSLLVCRVERTSSHQQHTFLLLCGCLYVEMTVILSRSIEHQFKLEQTYTWSVDQKRDIVSGSLKYLNVRWGSQRNTHRHKPTTSGYFSQVIPFDRNWELPFSLFTSRW